MVRMCSTTFVEHKHGEVATNLVTRVSTRDNGMKY